MPRKQIPKCILGKRTTLITLAFFFRSNIKVVSTTLQHVSEQVSNHFQINFISKWPKSLFSSYTISERFLCVFCSCCDIIANKKSNKLRFFREARDISTSLIAFCCWRSPQIRVEKKPTEILRYNFVRLIDVNAF